MTEHNINIDTKYFEPVHDKKITLLIFDKKIIDCKPNDKLTLQNGSYSVTATIEKTEIKSFGELTEKEVQKAGFITKDFLKDEMFRRFDIQPIDFLRTIDGFLIYCIYLKEQSKYTFNISTGGIIWRNSK